jgi:hypothetical protein
VRRGAGGVFDRAFKTRQNSDIDQAVIGSGCDRRRGDQRNEESKQPVPGRDFGPAHRSQHLRSPVLPAPDPGRATVMAATSVAHDI